MITRKDNILMQIDERPKQELIVLKNMYGEINLSIGWKTDEEDSHSLVLSEDDALEVVIYILDVLGKNAV